MPSLGRRFQPFRSYCFDDLCELVVQAFNSLRKRYHDRDQRVSAVDDHPVRSLISREAFQEHPRHSIPSLFSDPAGRIPTANSKTVKADRGSG